MACPYCTDPTCWRLNPPPEFQHVPSPFPAVPVLSFDFPGEIKRALRSELSDDAAAAIALPHLQSIAAEHVASERAQQAPRSRAESAAWKRIDVRARERTDKQLQRQRTHIRKIVQGLTPESLLSSCALGAGLNRAEIVQMLRDLEASTLSPSGAKPHDRRLELNVAVVLQHVGIELAISRVGKYWRILQQIYEAIGIDGAEDGLYAIKAVIEQVKAGEWSWCAYEFEVRLTACMRHACNDPDVRTWRMSAR